MSDLTLTKTRLSRGVWEGMLTGQGAGSEPPALEVTHLGTPLEGVDLRATGEPGQWLVRVPVPAELIADGVQTFLIRDPATGETLESFAVIAGEALSHDIRAEMTLLREELDMLKRAFRRHCLETM